jgi:hypothetical protein
MGFSIEMGTSNRKFKIDPGYLAWVRARKNSNVPQDDARINDFKKHFATAYVRKIEGQIGLRRQPVALIFDKKDVEALKVGREKKNWYEKCYGAYLAHVNVIYLNLTSFHKFKNIELAIIHELIHRRFPKLRHGLSFENMVQQVYNGKRLPWIILVKSNFRVLGSIDNA